MRRKLVAAVVLALLLLAQSWARPAAACSCMYSSPSRDLLPAGDATGFPTDGLLRVFLTGDWPQELRVDVGQEYRLRGPDGALVPLRARLAGSVVELQPRRALAPATTYTLERAFPYRHGRLLTDAQRWAAARGGRQQEASVQGIVLRWFPDRSFTTATGPESRRPTAPRITSARAAQRRGGGDCGPGESVVVDLALPDDLLPTDMVALEVWGQGISWRAPYRPPTSPGGPARPSRAILSDLLCTPDKVHVALEGGVAEVRALVLTAGGQVVVEDSWTTAAQPRDDAESRAPRDHDGVPATSTQAHEAIRRLRTIPWSEDPVVAAPGPEACPHGLEAVDHRVLADRIWAQLDRGLVGPGAAWLMVEHADGRRREVVDLAGPAPRLPALHGSDHLSLHGDQLLRLAKDEGRSTSPLTVALHARDGTELWRTRLGPDDQEISTEFSAVGPDRVLVGWQRWEPGLIRHQHWALLDRDDGAVVALGDMADFSPEERRVDAVAWHDGHFVLAWIWSKPTIAREPELGPAHILEGVYLTWLDDSGQVVRTVPQPGEIGRIAALHATEAGLVAVGHAGPDLVFGRLDTDGALAADPVLLNLGAPSGGNVHLGSWQGLSAVLWNARSSGGAWVTVVDDAGVAARPFHLGDHSGSLDAVLLAGPDDLLVAYGETGHQEGVWSPVAEHLACRTDPMPGPPPMLAEGP